MIHLYVSIGILENVVMKGELLNVTLKDRMSKIIPSITDLVFRLVDG